MERWPRTWARSLGLRSSAGTPARWVALDRLRALAVLFMIQGHVFTALLGPSSLSGTVMRWHERLHGLTAPAFLFGAGLAFGTATYGQYAQHSVWSVHVARRMRRYALLLVLGYALQAPGGALWSALHAEGETLRAVSRVGPLQVVALALCVCQLAIWLVPSPRLHALCMLAPAVLAVHAASPLAESAGTDPGAGFLAAFLQDRGGAHFQPCPWAGFVFAGVGCAGLLFHAPVRLRGLSLLGAGGLCAWLAHVQYQAAALAPEPGWLWRTSPSYFLFRLGCVALLMGLLHAWPQRGSGRLSALLARHSLAAYVIHLLLLHGTPWTLDVAHTWARSLDPLRSSAVALAIIGTTLVSVHGWARLQRWGSRVLQNPTRIAACNAVLRRFAGWAPRDTMAGHETGATSQLRHQPGHPAGARHQRVDPLRSGASRLSGGSAP